MTISVARMEDIYYIAYIKQNHRLTHNGKCLLRTLLNYEMHVALQSKMNANRVLKLQHQIYQCEYNINVINYGLWMALLFVDELSSKVLKRFQHNYNIRWQSWICM